MRDVDWTIQKPSAYLKEKGTEKEKKKRKVAPSCTLTCTLVESTPVDFIQTPKIELHKESGTSSRLVH